MYIRDLILLDYQIKVFAKMTDSVPVPNDQKNETSRASGGMMSCSFFQTSRVRQFLDSHGLNRHITEFAQKVKDCAEKQSTATGEDVSTVKFYSLLDETTAKFLLSNQLTALPTKRADGDDAKMVLRDEFAKFSADKLNEHFTLDQCNVVLQNAKFRISPEMSVALALVADAMTNEICVHTITQTLNDGKGKTDMQVEHFLNNVSSLYVYPLIAPLKCLKEALSKASDKDALKLLAAPTANSSTELNFMYSVGRITAGVLSAVAEQSRPKVRLTESFKRVVSALVVEFISERVSNMIKHILVKPTKTVNEQHVFAVLNIMMTDVGADPTTLFKVVNEGLDLYRKNDEALSSPSADKTALVRDMKESLENKKYEFNLNLQNLPQKTQTPPSDGASSPTHVEEAPKRKRAPKAQPKSDDTQQQLQQSTPTTPVQPVQSQSVDASPSTAETTTTQKKQSKTSPRTQKTSKKQQETPSSSTPPTASAQPSSQKKRKQKA